MNAKKAYSFAGPGVRGVDFEMTSWRSMSSTVFKALFHSSFKLNAHTFNHNVFQRIPLTTHMTRLIYYQSSCQSHSHELITNTLDTSTCWDCTQRARSTIIFFQAARPILGKSWFGKFCIARCIEQEHFISSFNIRHHMLAILNVNQCVS